MNVVTLKKTLIWLEVKETVLMLSVSVILPFMIHMIPSFAGITLGARLIPMFYAPFIAVILFRPHVAIITGLLSSTLNSLLTGHPTPEKVGVLTFELVVFCALSYLFHRKWRHFWGTAPLAYLLVLLSIACALGSREFFVSTMVTALPGIAMLTLINVFLLRSQPKRDL